MTEKELDDAMGVFNWDVDSIKEMFMMPESRHFEDVLYDVFGYIESLRSSCNVQPLETELKRILIELCSAAKYMKEQIALLKEKGETDA